MIKQYPELYSHHVPEIQRRWESALEAENVQAVVVHSGTSIISFQDDFEYAFRPNPNFLAWLPLGHHQDSVLVIRLGATPVLFYFQPDDYWHVPPSDPASWWADQFEIRVVRQSDQWQQGVAELLGTDLHHVAAIGDAPSLHKVFGETQINPAGLVHRLQLARTQKTPYELACMRDASALAAVAHSASERAFRAGAHELAIHQAYLKACQQADSELPYHNIVALNNHGAVLHYQGRSTDTDGSARSFLIDAGCCVNAYASDITRTYAREPGEFADLISAMDEMQLSLISIIREGIDYRDLHLQAHGQIAAVLQQFGIINVSPDVAVETGLSSVFFPHGLGHYIGLQTHDVVGLVDDAGTAIPRPEGHPFLRLTRKLEAGNVVTIEPGLYFIEPLLRKWKQEHDASVINWDRVEALMPYGGIRIEDNIVVTPDGFENMTRKAFAEID